MRRLLAAFTLSIAAVVMLTVAGSAFAAETVSIHGTLANGGCGPVQPVAVGGPSRIDVSMSTTESSGLLYAQFLDSSGAVLASGTKSYDTADGGDYGVQICSYWDSQNQPSFTYDGLVGTGPAGQPALPTPTPTPPTVATTPGGVLGVSAVLASRATGSAAIGGHPNLTWFTMSARNGTANVKVSSKTFHMNVTGLKANFYVNSVQLGGKGISVVVMNSRGGRQHITFHSSHFNASGNVVRGGITFG